MNEHVIPLPAAIISLTILIYLTGMMVTLGILILVEAKYLPKDAIRPEGRIWAAFYWPYVLYEIVKAILND